MLSFKTCNIFYLIVVFSACNLYGQQIDSTKQKGIVGFGGPDQVERRLEKDEEAAKEFILTHSQKNPSEGSVSDLEMSLDSELKILGKDKKKKMTMPMVAP